MSIILKFGLLFMIIMFCSMLKGLVLDHKYKLDWSLSKMIIFGFTYNLVAFQILAVPFIYLNGSFRRLAWIYTVIILVLVVAELVYVIRNKLFQKLKFINKINIVVIVAIGLIIMQAFCSSYLYQEDDDDGYFIAISNLAIEKDELILNGNYVYNGTTLEDTFRPETASWEVYVAYLSYISHIEPVVLAHSLLPFMLILLCYMVVYTLGMEFFKDKNRVFLFLCFYALLNMFGGYCVYSTGCFLLLRIWQGKAMLANFFFPLTMVALLEIAKSKSTRKIHWMNNMIVLIGGMSSTVVAVYLMPIYYVMLGIPYLCYLYFEKKEVIGKTIIWAIVSMIPSILVGLWSVVCVITSPAGSSYLQSTPPIWEDIFNNTMGQGYFFWIFVVAIIYFVIKGDWKRRVFVVGSTVVLFATFLNPLFINLVATHITGVDVYWRLYWMLPIYVGIALFTTEIVYIISIRYAQVLVTILLCFVIYKAGVPLFSNSTYFKAHINMYKISDTTMEICDFLLEQNKQSKVPIVIFPGDMSAKIRQYTPYIATPMARNMQYSEEMIEDTDLKYSELYSTVYTTNNMSDSRVLDSLNKLKVDYLVTPIQLSSDKCMLIKTLKGYNIYQYKK